MEQYMKNKQKLKYVQGIMGCDTINSLYLERDWRVVSIHPINSRSEIGAYILLEKENTEENSVTEKPNTTAGFGWV